MPIGAERIGSAYVRIFGDGSSLPGDIRDALGEADDDIEAAGSRQGDAYAKKFDESMTKRAGQRQFGSGLRDRLMESLAEGDSAKAYFESEDWRRFNGVLKQRFGEAGTVAGANLRERFSSSTDGLAGALGNIEVEIRRATAQIAAAEDQVARDQAEDRDRDFAANVRRLAAFAEAQEDFANEGKRQLRLIADQEQADRDRDFEQNLRRLSEYAQAQERFAEEGKRQLRLLAEQEQRDRDQEFEIEVRRLSALARAQEDFAEEGKRQLRDRQKREQEYFRATKNRAEELAEALARLGTDSERASDSQSKIIRDLRSLGDALSPIAPGTDRDNLSVRISDLRREAINATPASDRLNASLLRMGDTIGVGRGSRNNFINAVGSLNRGLFNLATLGPRVGFAVGSQMFNAFEVAGRGADGARAAVGVLGSTLLKGVGPAVAIGGALAALAFILGPVAALISGVTAAVIGLAGSVGLGAIAGIVGLGGALSAAFIGAGVGVLAINGLSDAVKDRLRPGLDDLSDSFDRLKESAGDSIAPGLIDAVDELAPALDRVSPLTDAVAKSLGDLARQYAEGFNSDGFSRFIEQITPSLAQQVKDLGDGLQGFAEGSGGFFVAAQPLISDFVRGLRDIGNEFSEYANSKEGRDEITAFLEKAADSAQSVGGFLGNAGEALGKLLFAGADSGDTIFDDLSGKLQEFSDYLSDPANQGAVGDFFANGVDIARDLGNAVKFVGDVINDLDTEESRAQLQALFDLLGKVGDAVQIFTGLGDVFPGSLSYITNPADAFRDLVGLADDAVGAVKGFFTGSDGAASSGNLSQELDRIFGSGQAAVEGLRAAAQAADDLAGTFDQTTGAITRQSQALIAARVVELDNQGTLNALGITQRDVVNATLGRVDAQRRVNAAVANSSEIDKERAQALLDFIGIQRRSVREGQASVRQNSLLTQSFESLRGVVSDDLRLKLESEGIEPTRRGLAQVVDRYDALNTRKNIKKLIEATGVDTTVKDIRRVIENLQDVDNQKPKPTLDADDKPAKDKLNGLEKLIREYNRENPNPNLDANDRPARAKIDGVSRLLSNLNRDSATPVVNLGADNFFATEGSVRSAVGNLDNLSATIDIIANRIGNFDLPFGGGGSGADGGTVGEGTLVNRAIAGLAGGGTVPGARYPYGDKDLYRLAAGEEVISNRNGQAERHRTLLKAINAGAVVNTAGPQKTIDASGWVIQTNTVDTKGVADEVLNEMMARTF